MKTVDPRTIFILLSFLLLIMSSSFAQIGIGNIDPKSSLDISATNPATPTATDGILIPRVNSLFASPGADQDGMMVYLTTDNTFYFWEYSTTSWYSLSSSNGSSGEHYIGEKYGGGIIFYLNEDRDSGLIVSLDDQNSGSNTNWSSAVTASDSYSITVDTVTYSDWYLPEISELILLNYAHYKVSNAMDTYTDTESNTANWLQFEKYWSSTEDSGTQAHNFRFDHSHSEDAKNKTDNNWVRAIRSF